LGWQTTSLEEAKAPSALEAGNSPRRNLGPIRITSLGSSIEMNWAAAQFSVLAENLAF
jgi:hypothetical protein